MLDQLVDAMIWWDKWQLRVLVLGSLILQWLAAPMRKYVIPRWFRACIWLAYIKAEAARLTDQSGAKYTIIHDACKLAEALIGIEDEKETRWHLMYRVWVGMLCYSAGMCKGYLHAKSLGEGGEFLSVVWLIISLKGAKTLADKLQMPEPEDGDDDVDVDHGSDCEESLPECVPVAVELQA